MNAERPWAAPARRPPFLILSRWFTPLVFDEGPLTVLQVTFEANAELELGLFRKEYPDAVLKDLADIAIEGDKLQRQLLDWRSADRGTNAGPGEFGDPLWVRARSRELLRLARVLQEAQRSHDEEWSPPRC